MKSFKLTTKDLRYMYGLLIVYSMRLSSFKINDKEGEKYRLNEIKRISKLRNKIFYYLNNKSLAEL